MSKRVLNEEVQLPNIYIERNTGKHAAAAVVCLPNLLRVG